MEKHPLISAAVVAFFAATLPGIPAPVAATVALVDRLLVVSMTILLGVPGIVLLRSDR